MSDKDLAAIRKELHAIPEPGGDEAETAACVRAILEETGPDELITGLGGHGLAAVYGEGKSIMLRAELDALPIRENNDFGHRSRRDGFSHACGHDGHMAILLGVARRLKETKGFRVILLFQPSEERGGGARAVMEDERFEALAPEFIFALHNLPGFPKGRMIVKDGAFACASKGLDIRLSGQTSHAGEKSLGRSPATALTEIMEKLDTIPERTGGPFADLTITHARLGEEGFGTSPGEARLMATLRSGSDGGLEEMAAEALEILGKTSDAHGIGAGDSWHEHFPVTFNDSEAVGILDSAAKKAGMERIRMDRPFKWSEDFGYFTQKFKGALFGLGAGEEHPRLHSQHYDFPDDIIEDGVRIMMAVLGEAADNQNR